MPLTIGLIAATTGMGVAKGISNKNKEGRQRALAAETNRWSPWTGMTGQAPDEGDGAIMGGLGGGLTGVGMVQNINNASHYNKWLDAKTPQPTNTGDLSGGGYPSRGVLSPSPEQHPYPNLGVDGMGYAGNTSNRKSLNIPGIEQETDFTIPGKKSPWFGQDQYVSKYQTY